MWESRSSARRLICGLGVGGRRLRASILAAMALLLASFVVSIPTQASAAADDGPWALPSHSYRFAAVITPTADGDALYPILNVDFTTAFVEAGAAGVEFDETTLVIHEVDSSGLVLSTTVPFQFDRDPGFDPVTSASGELSVEVSGPTSTSQSRHFLVYFDTVGSGATGASLSDQVIVDSSATDEDHPAVSIDTPSGTWFYHSEGGGFSSLLDSSAADWIGWSDAPRSSGEFRGLPNLVHPAGYFHPGATGHATTVVNDGPLRATLVTTSPDGNWEMRWDLFPTHAHATVVTANGPYWFLYEGTPGGVLEPATDFWALSSGTKKTASRKFNADLAAPEWIQFGDPVADRSLFLIHHSDDGEIDSYRPMDNAMTVFGFGRTKTQRLLTGSGREFTVGLIDTADQAAAGQAIGSLIAPPTTSVGPGRSQVIDGTAPAILAGPSAVANHDSIDVSWTTDEAATSVVEFGTTPTLGDGTSTSPGFTVDHNVSFRGLSCETSYFYRVTSTDPSGNEVMSGVLPETTATCEYPLDITIIGGGTVEVSPDAPSYAAGTNITLAASPAPGGSFLGWSGDASGSEPSIGLVVPAAPVSVTAEFSEPVGSSRVGGEVVLYEFDEGSGSIVGDSGAGSALDLQIDDLSAVSWMSSGGLQVDDALILSPGPATKVFDAVALSGEISVEAWVLPADVTQGGPARIVSSAAGPTARNFMLGQGAWGSRPDDVFASRLRTSSSVSGTPTLFSPEGSASVGLTHVVVTRSAGGQQTQYVDGVAVSSSVVTGDLSNWDLSYPLSIANIASGDRPWQGLLCLVGIYDAALSAVDIATNFDAGCGSPGNAAPIVDPLADQVSEVGIEVSVPVSATDTDGDTLAYSATGLPQGLTIDAASGLIAGTPGSIGVNTVTVDVTDGVAVVSTSFSWEIFAPSSPPVAADDSYTGDEDSTISVDGTQGVLANDSDPESDQLTAVLVDDVSAGSLNLATDGSFVYTPQPDFSGTDSFTYRASDGPNQSDLATVTLTISAVDDPPTAVSDIYQVDVDSVLSVDALLGVLVNDSDPELDPLTAVLVDDVVSGVLNLALDGSFVYSPDPGFAGTDSFSYRASDGANTSSPATAIIQVGADNVAPRIITGTVGFERQVIDSSLDETHVALAADLDGDGDSDIVATDYVNDRVLWFENDGSGGFSTNTVDGALDGAYPADLADLDDDGDIDVLAAGYLADSYTWYENDGAGNFVKHVIDGSIGGPHSIIAVDVDTDGDKDLVTSSQDADRVAWYENDGDQNFQLHVVDSARNGAKRADAADIDGDGDVDIIAIDYFGDDIFWYENNGSEVFARHQITGGADGGYYVDLADLDGDGDLDVLAASRRDDTVSWHENDGTDLFGAEHFIDTSADAVRTAIASDVDGDGDLDVVAASVDADTVSWYENDGNGNFIAQQVDTSVDGAYGVSAFDFDGDGDIDLLSAGHDDDTANLHTSVRIHSVAAATGGTSVIDSTLLESVDPDNAASEVVYTLIETPSFGALERAGSSVGTGGTFTQADIDQGLISYVHDGSASTEDSFRFRVSDPTTSDLSSQTGSVVLTIG